MRYATKKTATELSEGTETPNAVAQLRPYRTVYDLVRNDVIESLRIKPQNFFSERFARALMAELKSTSQGVAWDAKLSTLDSSWNMDFLHEEIRKNIETLFLRECDEAIKYEIALHKVLPSMIKEIGAKLTASASEFLASDESYETLLTAALAIHEETSVPTPKEIGEPSTEELLEKFANLSRHSAEIMKPWENALKSAGINTYDSYEVFRNLCRGFFREPEQHFNENSETRTLRIYRESMDNATRERVLRSLHMCYLSSQKLDERKLREVVIPEFIDLLDRAFEHANRELARKARSISGQILAENHEKKEKRAKLFRKFAWLNFTHS